MFTFKPYTEILRIGIFEKNYDLGYVPKKNFSFIINEFGWKNIKLNIDNFSLRKTINNNKNAEKILTVGDSYTFGDQVQDEQTWQSCLNKNYLNKKFLNAGVSGYGTAQSILRAQKLYPIIRPSKLMISTLFGHNFSRDQLEISNGFPKPYLAKIRNKNIEIVKPKSFDIPNTRYSEIRKNNFLDHLIINFTVIKRLPYNSYLSNIYWKSHRNLTSTIRKKGDKHASIKEIINWSINKSKEIDTNVTWLLQYEKEINIETIKERKLIRKLLTESNIKYIDTFDILHGKNKPDLSKQKIWDGHHTSAGNLLVCKSIIDSEIY